MRRLILFALTFAFLGSVAVPSGSMAQDEAGIGPAIGESSAIRSPDGSEIGTILVEDVTDPFPELPSNYEPPRGYRVAAVTVTIENTASRPFEVTPNSVQVFDAEGYLARAVFISLDESAGTVALEYLDALAPGTSVTGTMFVEIFTSSSVARVLYTPNREILQTVADLRTSLTDAGTPQSIVGASGEEILQVTVVSLIDGWDGYDESYAPERGSRYLLVEYSVVNTGDRVRSVGPNDFVAIDGQGFVLESAFVVFSNPGMVPFEFLDLPPGEEQRGFVVVTVFGDIPVEQLLFGNLFDRNIVIADLGEGSAPPPTPEIAPPPTEVASAPECEGLLAWSDELNARSEPYNDVVNSIFPDEEGAIAGDPESLMQAADALRALAEEQSAAETPEILQLLNDYVVNSFYLALADSLETLASAQESGDAGAEEEAQAAINALLEELFAGTGEFGQIVADLSAICPAEVEEMGLA